MCYRNRRPGPCVLLCPQSPVQDPALRSDYWANSPPQTIPETREKGHDGPPSLHCNPGRGSLRGCRGAGHTLPWHECHHLELPPTKGPMLIKTASMTNAMKKARTILCLYDHFKYTQHTKINADVIKMTKYPGHARQPELRAALGMERSICRPSSPGTVSWAWLFSAAISHLELRQWPRSRIQSWNHSFKQTSKKVHWSIQLFEILNKYLNSKNLRRICFSCSFYLFLSLLHSPAVKWSLREKDIKSTNSVRGPRSPSPRRFSARWTVWNN